MTTTETTNTSVITEIFEAFGRGDVPTILSRLSDDVRFTSHLEPVVPWAGAFSGKDEVVAFFTAMGTAIEVLDHPVTQLVAQDDVVVAMGDVHFRVRATEEMGASSWVYVWKLREGEVVSYDQFNDTGLAAAFR